MKNDKCMHRRIDWKISLSRATVHVHDSCVRVFVQAHESACMLIHVECVYAITRRCSRACVNTCASTHERNAVSESSLRVCGRGQAWRESACRAHVSFRVPSLHRHLYVRCNPSWGCAAERDNAALTCVPLAQARITALLTYFGPADTCEVRA